MDIVDAQLHIGPGKINETIAAMDALGIQAALIDEYWMVGSAGNPGYRVPDDAFRPIQPTAELAAMLHPDRFSYLVRVDRKDREVLAVVRAAGFAPYARALRITPGMWLSENEAFDAGEYDSICAAACDTGLPLFIFAPTQAAAVARTARKFPSLRLIFDHCGLISNSIRMAVSRDKSPHSSEQQQEAFEEVLRLADSPNVALKWAHAPAMFGLPGFPGTDLWPILRRAIDAFGSERVMWASDVTANQTGESWAELLFAVRGMPDLSGPERNALLGGAVRAWLNWPQ